MECFVIIVNGWKPLTIITKRLILDVAAVLDTRLPILHHFYQAVITCPREEVKMMLIHRLVKHRVFLVEFILI